MSYRHNKPYTLGIVLAHGKARDAVIRHEQYWLENCDKLVYFTPTNDPLNFPDRQEYSVGLSKAYSHFTNQRCREALRFAAMTTYEYVMLIEYDSLVFGKIPAQYYPDNHGVAAPVFNNADSKFKSPRYLHFPQLFNIVALRAVVRAMDQMPIDAEHGFTDRYVGRAVEEAKIGILDLNPTGFVYTQNLIDQSRLPEAIKAIRKGARWHHGIKDALVLKTLADEAARVV